MTAKPMLVPPTLTSTMTQPLPSHELIRVDSAAFTHFIEMLVYLKEPVRKPIIEKLNPKMCLTCWHIFTDREKTEHPQGGGPGPNPPKHKITGTFKSMAPADKSTFLGLSRHWNKT